MQYAARRVDHPIGRDGPGRGSGRLAEPGDAGDDCTPHSLDDQCIYADVLRADRRLHAAYAQAAKVGVPRVALLSATRRWRQARAIAQDRPDEAIRLYDALADDLDGYVAGGAR